jgi:5'-deoxynucleotidase YfbR-like HD superfamily hydrolase
MNIGNGVPYQRPFDYANPSPDMFLIDDISLSLSRECRFVNRTTEHYSVAQHCVLASYLVPEYLEFEALVHDIAESHVRDLPTPMKALLPEYKRLEERVSQAIRIHLGLPPVCAEEDYLIIKQADLRLFVTERRDLLPKTNDALFVHKPGFEESLIGIDPMTEKIIPLSSEAASTLFLVRYEELVEKFGYPNMRAEPTMSLKHSQVMRQKAA